MMERFTAAFYSLGDESELNRYGTGGNCKWFGYIRPDDAGAACDGRGIRIAGDNRSEAVRGRMI